jgi:hypothetical protein
LEEEEAPVGEETGSSRGAASSYSALVELPQLLLSCVPPPPPPPPPPLLLGGMVFSNAGL